jgi:alpha-tubulin suppressor-like RCC1 family protein
MWSENVMTISDEGEVFGWGNSEYSQLLQEEVQQIHTPRYLEKCQGLGKIIDVAAGGSFCIAANGRFDCVSEPEFVNVVANHMFCLLICFCSDTLFLNLSLFIVSV